MNNRKRMVSILAGIMAAVMLLTLILGLLPTRASAASSSEIRKQINALKEEKKQIQEKIAEVKEQYEANENEIADIIAKKSVIDQEVQLLNTQITNIKVNTCEDPEESAVRGLIKIVSDEKYRHLSFGLRTKLYK